MGSSRTNLRFSSFHEVRNRCEVPIEICRILLISWRVFLTQLRLRPVQLTHDSNTITANPTRSVIIVNMVHHGHRPEQKPQSPAEDRAGPPGDYGCCRSTVKRLIE